MPNNFFQFKQFTVYQEMCAMKVCTDACVFGALVASQLQHGVKGKILDIGCGTGLLSLMLAQKIPTGIDAVEVNEDAAVQAKENINASPWADRITIQQADIREFLPTEKYGLIISNPPFFESDLRSPDEHKNSAKHDSSLKLDELLTFISMHIEVSGMAAILLPYHRTTRFEDMASNEMFFVQKKVLIRQTVEHDFFRSVLFISPEKNSNPEIETMAIHDSNRQYTEAFTSLLKDYYLKC